MAHHPVDSTVALHRKMFSPLASLLLQLKHVGLEIVSTINEGVNVCVKACLSSCLDEVVTCTGHNPIIVCFVIVSSVSYIKQQ